MDRSLHTTTSSSLLDGLQDPENRTIWGQYVDRYRPVIAGYARKLGLSPDDAEDAAQETLLAFSDSYREGKYDRDRGRLRSWLFGIAHNQIRNLARRRAARERGRRNADQLDDLPARDELEELWEQEWRDAVIRQCLDEVRREFQASTLQAFQLFVLEGRSAESVAQELDTTANAVFVAKHRVLKRIRTLIPTMEDIW